MLESLAFRFRRIPARWSVAVLIGLLICLALPKGLRRLIQPTAHAANFIVTTADDHDDGTCNADCTLREAINAANANPDADIITFNIPVAGVHTINATGGFLISKPVTIDGTTQPDFAGTPLIELNGAGAGSTIGLNIQAQNVTVKGLIINRFSNYGITFDSFGGDTVQGCYIGTDATGTIARPNGAGGIRINVSGITIGGPTAAARNVISGNTGNGIDIVSGGPTIQGNFIGTDAAGNAAVANSEWGIFIDNSPGSTIGGTAPGAGNVISGNSDYGILISGNSASNNQVQGNLIGTNVSGIAKVSNGAPGNTGGISVGGSNNTIGGTATGAGNIISGNNNQGLDITGTSNVVQGNFIGTDITGNVALGNFRNGIAVGGNNHLIGGTSAAARNVISGNDSAGIFLCSCAGAGSGIQVQGNYIGVRADGTGALANASGVLITGLSNNTIGGTAAGAGNVISGNSGAGVAVFSGGTTGNTILGNSIFSNGGLGIDLDNDVVINANDNCDADTGPNNLQNFPVLTSATAGATNTTIQGAINSTASTQFRIEFFANSSCDSAGNGEGRTFLGSKDVTTDGSCNVSFVFVVPNASITGTIITATATDPNNNTSEFSPCVVDVGLVLPTMQFSASNYPVGEGDGHATITVTRSGDTTNSASIDYKTIDDPAQIRCDVFNNTAYARCDYATTLDTLTFAPGETSKPFAIPIIDDSYAEGSETFTVTLSNATGGASLGSPATATVTIIDNDAVNGPNPILRTDDVGIAFFVRQHYLDFLAREPEPGEPWSAILHGCADQFNVDPGSPSAGCDRLTVSGSFFGSPEFLSKGVYTIVFYRVAFNRLPQYVEFAPDLRSVTGATPAETFAKRATFANNFVLRPEFAALPNMSTNTQYVNTLMGRYSLSSITTLDPANPDGTAKVTLTSAQMIAALNGATLTRAQVLRAIVQSDQVSGNLEAVNAFVASQYYGYLRRTPDTGGFNSWINYLSLNPGDFRTMVNGFMNSIEYRLRFGP